MQPNETLPGFRTQNVFEARGIDNVNLYNGDPGVAIPLGPEYTLGPAFTWQLKAYYSAKFWQFSPCDPERRAFIRGDPTLGVGWTLQLGYVVASVYNTGVAYQWTYYSPDGSAHEVDLDPSPSDVTNDGSRLRITASPDAQDPTQYTVEFPDGIVATFAHSFDPPHETAGTSKDLTNLAPGETDSPRFGLTSIKDSFGTTLLTVAYDSVYPWEPASITLNPGGPARTITFVWTPYTVGSVMWQVLDNIVFPAAGAAQLKAAFTYQPATFARNSYDNTSSPAYCAWTGGINVPKLATITLSDPATSSFTAFDYDFEYFLLPSGDPLQVQQQGALKKITLPTLGTIEYVYGRTTQGSCQISSGCNPESAEPARPDEATLPEDLTRFNEFLDKSIAVTSRTEYDPVANQTAVTTYLRSQYFATRFCPACEPDPAKFVRRTTVTSPGNDAAGPTQFAVRYYFHVDFLNDSDIQQQDGGIELERRHYPGADTAVTPVRSIVSCWGTSATANCGYHLADGSIRTFGFLDLPPKQGEVTWFGAVPASADGSACPTGTTPCIKTFSTDYNNTARRFRTTTVTNANLTSGGATRTTYTRWIPFTDATHWLLDLYDEQNETQASTTIYRGFEFDIPGTPSTSTTPGFLRGTWTSDQPYDPANATLVINCRYPNTDGTVANEFSATFGPAILQNNPPAAAPAPYSRLCFSTYPAFPAAGVPSDDAFGHAYTWVAGQKKTDKWINGYASAPTTLPWFAFDATRDNDTGLITTSRDTAGQQTIYAYDGLGRLTTVTPPGEIATTITYNSTTETTVLRNGVAPDDTWERYHYDGLGRVIRELRQMKLSPTAEYAVRKRSYDKAGRQVFISEWASCTSLAGNCLTASPAGTTSSNYDPFGRPGTIIGPNNATYAAIDRTDGSIVVSDTLEKVTSCVNGTWNGSACTGTGALIPYTTTRRDIFGRIVSVTEPGLDVTTYAYDGNDKLISVAPQGNPPQSARTFTYDAYGNLRREVTPEKGAVDSMGFLPGGTMKFGSLGNVRQRTEGHGTSDARTHDYTYDPAGRLKEDKVGATQYLMNCYDGSAVSTCPDGSANPAGGTSPKGKLTRQVATNPLFVPLHPVQATAEQIQEEYTYSGIGGRPSKKVTRLQTGAVDRAVEEWTYNTLGLLSTHRHPRMADGTFSPGVTRGSLVETITYTYGLPTLITLSGSNYNNTSVTGATIEAEYHPAGNLKSFTASQTNGPDFTTTITQDASGLPRPNAISTSLGGFSTGTYTYDAAGNIRTIGTDEFKYDSRSRLISAKYAGQTTICTDTALNTNRNQCFAYDRYGNLTGVTGTNARPLGTSTSTNRLSSGTYDGRGNLKVFSPDTRTWDDLNRMIRDVRGGGVDWQYLYNGSNERLVRQTASAGGTPVTRRDVARYITQAKVQASQWSLTGAACVEASRDFTDVHCNDPDWDYIQTFVDEQITAGCGGTSYCPETQLPREQMAVLLLKAEHGSGYNPPACVGTFGDVPCTSPYAKWIEQLFEEGITSGCQVSPPLFCPTQIVTEQQMAVFLSKNDGTPQDGGVMWPNYHGIPGGSTYTLRDQANRVVTEFADSFASRDNIFLGNLVVASYVPNQPSMPTPEWHFHAADHLGTPRLSVRGSGTTVETHKYWPFGDEVGTPPLSQRLAFATMERDPEANHFYDHARTHDFNLGRFASPDKVGGGPEYPQSWNRYAYGLGNPMKYVDPDGRAAQLATDFQGNEITRQTISAVVSANPTLGQGGAVITDAVLSLFLPASPNELIANSMPVVGEAVIAGQTGSLLTKLSTSLQNAFAKNLARDTVEAAARESAGQVVARKASGQAFNHVAKYEQARAGVTNKLDQLKGLLARGDLTPAERQRAQQLLSHYSKRLDQVERQLQRVIPCAQGQEACQR